VLNLNKLPNYNSKSVRFSAQYYSLSYVSYFETFNSDLKMFIGNFPSTKTSAPKDLDSLELKLLRGLSLFSEHITVADLRKFFQFLNKNAFGFNDTLSGICVGISARGMPEVKLGRLQIISTTFTSVILGCVSIISNWQ
jgi:hypothetical protein